MSKISTRTDSVKKFVVSIMTVTLRVTDFKSDYLLRMCSFASNLLKSLECNPIRRATTLCHSGQTRNGYVATHFILLSALRTAVLQAAT